MKAKTYIRMTQYPLPPGTGATALHFLAAVSMPLTIHEGCLLEDISIRSPIRLRGRYRDGHVVTEDYTSSPVIRIEPGYAVTSDALYQFLRVPCPGSTGVASQPVAKKPARTTVSKRDYHLLREGLYGQMEALAPDLAHIAALFRLHQDQFARVRRDMPDERTGEPMSAVDLDAAFAIFGDALCYRYSARDKRDQREREVWVAGHQVLAAVWNAVTLETGFLEKQGLLALFAGCQARVARMLHAWEHFATLLPVGAYDDSH